MKLIMLLTALTLPQLANQILCAQLVKQCEEILRPNANIAIISFSNTKLSALATRTYLKKYAQQWGYDLFHYHNPINILQSQAWNTSSAILQHLNNATYDWIAWIDSEILITNPDLSLEKIIAQHGPKKNVITQTSITPDSCIDASVILIRVCPWSYDIFTYLHTLIEQEGICSYESAFTTLLSNPSPKELKKIGIGSRKTLFGFDYSESFDATHFLWNQGDFATNLRYLSDDKRKQRIELLSRLFYPSHQEKVTPIDSLIHQEARIAIVSLSTPQPDRQAFASVTKEYLKKYAARHKYDFFYYDDIINPTWHPVWDKISALQRHMNSTKYDWIVWFDDDILITNFTIKLENIIVQYGNKKSILFQHDCNRGWIINSGLFFVRVNNMGAALLEAVCSYAHKSTTCAWLWQHCGEQYAFEDLARHVDHFGQQVAIIQQKALQGYFVKNAGWNPNLAYLNWSKGDFSAHLLGTPNNVRVATIKFLINYVLE